MNIFNRIIMVILMLCLIVFSIVAIVNVFANLFEWSLIPDRIVKYITNLNPFAFAAILFLILVISVVILFFEFYTRKVKVASITTDQAGKSMVTIKAVSSQIKEALSNLEGVLEPRVNIIPRGDGIIINTFSKLVKGVSIAEKTKQIRDFVKDFASEKLGFKVIQSNYTAVGIVPSAIEKAAEEYFPEVAREPKKEANKSIEEEKEISIEEREIKNI